MQLPNVDNFSRDQQSGITYNICAYPELSWEERMRAVQVFIQQQGCHPAKQKKVVKIFSVMGLSDR